jgi:type VI secretion system protein ImpL
LAPFVTKRLGAGYVAKNIEREKYPLTSPFLEFAARAEDARKAKRDFYPVSINALPTSTNLDAKYTVSKTELELLCSDGPTLLVNKNFPNSQQFKWQESCGDVKLSINVGRFVLEKRYSGELAFPDFLSDFRTGQKRFAASDFPESTEKLREAGISYIDIKYTMSGQDLLLDALDSKQLDIPRYISGCWNEAPMTASVAR